MYIEFENDTYIDDDFPNKKFPGQRWYVRKQAALLFKEGSKYPDKFFVNLVFTDNDTDQKKVGAFAPGKYELSPEAFILDQRSQLTLDPSKLRPVNTMKMKQVS